jgi:predicted transcriptional regulator
MKYRNKILDILGKKSTFTFDEIDDELRLDHEKFLGIIASMKNEGLMTINETKETISLK